MKNGKTITAGRMKGKDFFASGRVRFNLNHFDYEVVKEFKIN